MRSEIDYSKFSHLGFEDFRQLARDPSLSPYEKIGFPNSYRQGREKAIFADILSKLTNLQQERQLVVDVGPGCSGLAFLLIEHCRKHEHTLVLVDSEEMLSQLPDAPFIRKVPAYYPRDCIRLFEEFSGRVNALLSYSVLHYVFDEGNVYDFLDRSCGLLSAGGELLLGDIPNISKRKRFFQSASGIRFHQEFTGTNETPVVTFNTLETGQIDDAVIVSLLLRARSAGFDAYWLPQSQELPMANRREDILIRRP